MRRGSAAPGREHSSVPLVEPHGILHKKQRLLRQERRAQGGGQVQVVQEHSGHVLVFGHCNARCGLVCPSTFTKADHRHLPMRLARFRLACAKPEHRFTTTWARSLPPRHGDSHTHHTFSPPHPRFFSPPPPSRYLPLPLIACTCHVIALGRPRVVPATAAARLQRCQPTHHAPSRPSPSKCCRSTARLARSSPLAAGHGRCHAQTEEGGVAACRA